MASDELPILGPTLPIAVACQVPLPFTSRVHDIYRIYPNPHGHQRIEKKPQLIAEPNIPQRRRHCPRRVGQAGGTRSPASLVYLVDMSGIHSNGELALLL